MYRSVNNIVKAPAKEEINKTEEVNDKDQKKNILTSLD